MPLPNRRHNHARGHFAQHHTRALGRFCHIRPGSRAPWRRRLFRCRVLGHRRRQSARLSGGEDRAYCTRQRYYAISARTPAMIAQTALTLALLSGNRFILGLGVSGPQVIEGLHGQPFAHPLGRTRETIAIIRQAFAGERLRFAGRHITLPRPGGEGKALRLSVPPNPNIPIYLATLAPKMLELTGEVADGWIATSFIPEAAAVFTDRLAAGAARAGRRLAALDLSQGGDVAFSDDVDAL